MSERNPYAPPSTVDRPPHLESGPRYLVAKSHRDGLFALKGCHPGYLAEIKKEQGRVPLTERLLHTHI